MKALKNVIHFFVFQHLWISFAAVALVAETRIICGLENRVDALICFSFFSTLFVYNFHSFSYYIKAYRPGAVVNELLNPKHSLALKAMIVAGFAGTTISVFFLSRKIAMLFIPVGLLTMAYTLPLFSFEKKIRLREISYVKIFTISLIWSINTVLMPMIDFTEKFSAAFISVMILQRALFIYAITIPFEIRDIKRELSMQLKTIPIIHGIKKSKLSAYIALIIFSSLTLFFPIENMKQIFFVLLLSALSAAVLVKMTNENRSKWFYKFFVDGTMVLQWILCLIFKFAG